ncbi:hypothetical protein D3C86_1214180 [compost metagenome]
MDGGAVRGVDDGEGIQRIAIHQHCWLLVEFHGFAVVVELVGRSEFHLVLHRLIQHRESEVFSGDRYVLFVDQCGLQFSGRIQGKQGCLILGLCSMNTRCQYAQQNSSWGQ